MFYIIVLVTKGSLVVEREEIEYYKYYKNIILYILYIYTTRLPQDFVECEVDLHHGCKVRLTMCRVAREWRAGNDPWVSLHTLSEKTKKFPFFHTFLSPRTFPDERLWMKQRRWQIDSLSICFFFKVPQRNGFSSIMTLSQGFGQFF